MNRYKKIDDSNEDKTCSKDELDLDPTIKSVKAKFDADGGKKHTNEIQNF